MISRYYIASGHIPSNNFTVEESGWTDSTLTCGLTEHIGIVCFGMGCPGRGAVSLLGHSFQEKSAGKPRLRGVLQIIGLQGHERQRQSKSEECPSLETKDRGQLSTACDP